MTDTGQPDETRSEDDLDALADLLMTHHDMPPGEGRIYAGPETTLSAIRCGCGAQLPAATHNGALRVLKRHQAEAVTAAARAEVTRLRQAVEQARAVLDALETSAAEVTGRPIIDARVVAQTLRAALGGVTATPKEVPGE